MSKLKVKRKVTPKVPWYEKPPLLFGAIAALLIISGFGMAQINSRVSEAPEEGSDVDSVAIAMGDTVNTRWQATAGLLAADADLPTPGAGQMLPPILIETLRDAAFVRGRLRDVRGGEFAFARARDWLALAGEASWDALEMKADFVPQSDLEFHRDLSGEVYVAAFVKRGVAEAMSALGPRLVLTDAPVETGPPAWQFWRRRAEPEKLTLYRESVIELFPELSPEATCLVVLPIARLSPREVREVRLSRGLPIEVLAVALR